MNHGRAQVKTKKTLNANTTTLKLAGKTWAKHEHTMNMSQRDHLRGIGHTRSILHFISYMRVVRTHIYIPANQPEARALRAG